MPKNINVPAPIPTPNLLPPKAKRESKMENQMEFSFLDEIIQKTQGPSHILTATWELICITAVTLGTIA